MVNDMGIEEKDNEAPEGDKEPEEKQVSPEEGTEKRKPFRLNLKNELVNIIFFVVAFALAFTLFSPVDTVPVTIFHAGSLTVPLEAIKTGFEAANEGVTLQLEPAGSVTCVQKITELEQKADLLAVADYSLIPSLMMPEHADWYILFARNEMTLTYTNQSLYADEITEDNWYEILSRPDVKYGFSDPNQDPCGYRTLMTIQLSEIEYGEPTLFEFLVVNNSAITVIEDNNSYFISAATEDLDPNTEKLVIREKSVDLISLLEAGGLDYAFEYSSVAKQHDLQYLDLPASVDLSDIEYRDLYSRVTVGKLTGVSAGKPIVYGLTIPNDAVNSEIAESLVAYILGEDGQQVFTDGGQPSIVPAGASDVEAVPESLSGLVEEIE